MLDKKVNLTIKANASTEEITDTITDLFGVGFAVDEALEDGAQVSDIFVLAQQYPTIQEVINDFPTFLAEFMELTPATAMQAVMDAKARVEAIHGQLTRVPGFIFGLLMRLAGGFAFVEQTMTLAIQEFNAWKTLINDFKASAPLPPAEG